jgi:hypothetical protein
LGRITRLTWISEEALTVAALLAFVGGYIDAYSRIIHRAFAMTLLLIALLRCEQRRGSIPTERTTN